MYKIISFVIFVVALIIISARNDSELEQIINESLVEIKDYPFVVSVHYQCTGSLISDKCVLTNSNCATINQRVCGGTKYYGIGQCSKVEAFWLAKSPIEIAIVKLNKPLKGENIATVEMDFDDVAIGTDIQIIGFVDFLRARDFNIIAGEPSHCDKKLVLFAEDQTKNRTIIKGRNIVGNLGGPWLRNGKVIAVESTLMNTGIAYAAHKLSVIKQDIQEYYENNCL